MKNSTSLLLQNLIFFISFGLDHEAGGSNFNFSLFCKFFFLVINEKILSIFCSSWTWILLLLFWFQLFSLIFNKISKKTIPIDENRFSKNWILIYLKHFKPFELWEIMFPLHYKSRWRRRFIIEWTLYVGNVPTATFIKATFSLSFPLIFQ